MAIKVTTGQQTFIKKIVIGTPISTAQTGLSIDNFSDFSVATKSDGQILVYDSAEGAFKNYDLDVGNGLEKFYTPGNDKLLIQIDSSSSPVISGLTSYGNLLPGTDSTYDIGASDKKWKDLYLSGSTIHLGGIRLKDSGGDFSIKDSAGTSVNIDLAGSVQQIRGFFSSGGDLSYDSSTGRFQFDVEQVYTKANFDSDFNVALDEASVGGIGLAYDASTNTIRIDSSELETNFKQDIRGYFTAGGDLTYNSNTGEFTFDVEQVYTKANFDSDLSDANTGQLPEGSNLYYTTARADSDAKASLLGGTGVTYDSSTGIISIGQPVGTSDTVTFQEIRGPSNFIIDPAGVGDNTGTVQILGNLQVEGTQTIINSTTVSINDKNIILADSAANPAAADGAGITIEGANATLTYAAVGDKFVFNKPIEGQYLGFDSDFDSALSTKTTSNLTEGNNLYYTVARVDSDFDKNLDSASTDKLSEGSTNLYYTTARADSDARHSISVNDAGGDGSFTYDNTTGVLTYTGPSAQEVAIHLSANDAGGDGSFSYNNITGVFTYTGPSPAETRAHFTGDKGLTYNSTTGVFDVDSANIKGMFSASGDLTYNSGTGQFSIDVEQVYSKANFDSDLGDANTGQLPEGSNLYYTTARADSAFDVRLSIKTTTDLSEGTNLYYTTARADSDAKASLLAIDAGGDGSFTYDSSTGVMTYTGPSASETRVHFTGDKGLIYNSTTGVFDIDSANVRGMFSASGDLTYNSGTGQFSIDVEQVYSKSNFDSDLGDANTGQLPEGSNLYYTTARADSDAKNAISVTDAGGDGSFSYNSTTGVLTYTGPSASEVRAHFTAGEGIDITSGEISGEDATTSNKGIASFNTEHFSVTSGAVSIKADGIDDTHIDFGTGTNQVNTGDIPEQTNLYYTKVRVDSDFDARLAIKSTSDLSEGTNLYYTTARADSDAKASLFAVDAGGDGSFTYDSASGVMTYTGPSASETRAHFSGGTGVTITNGEIAIGQAVGTSDNVTFGDLSVSNLTVTGTTTEINTIVYTTNDPLIHLADSNENSDVVDIGFIGHYYRDGDRRHAGIFRDASNQEFYFFNNMVDSSFDSVVPPNVINRSATGYTGSTVNAGTFVGALTGNASTATTLATGRTIGMTGDVSWTSASFDGSGDVTGTSTLATVNSNVGSFGSSTQVPAITVNAKGLITGVTATNINHDALTNFVANEHIDHTSITLTAGNGLTGGGDISSSRTFAIDSANVRGMFSGGTGITYNSGTGEFSTTDGDIVHDNLSGFVANEHIDHSGVSIVAGNGLTGGGDITTSRTINIDSANVRGMFSASGDLTYNSGTGQFSIDVEQVYSKANFDSDLGDANTGQLPEGSNLYYTTARADSDAKNAISVTDAGGDGSITYNASTGVITYTGPSASEVRAHFSAGEGIDLASGVISGEDATISNKGIASFDSNQFSITAGAVSIKADGINDTHIDFGTGTNQVSTADIPEQTNLYYTDARVESLVDSAYVQARQSGGEITIQEEGSSLSTAATTLNFVGSSVTASGAGTTKTITITGTDSAAIISLIDSAYVQARQSGGEITIQEEGVSLSTAATTLNFVGSGVTASGAGTTKTITISGGGSGGTTGTINNVKADTFVGDNSTTAFTLSNAPSDSDDVLVFINGILQHTNTYSISGTTLTLDSAPDSASEIETRTHLLYSTNLILRDHKSYIYTLSTTTDSVSGADSAGVSLAYDVGKVDVFVNGARLVTGKDFTANNGTSIVFDSALTSGNIIEVVSHSKATTAELNGILSIEEDLITTTEDQIIYTYAAANHRTLKFTAQLEHDSSSSYHAEEVLLTHNGTNVAMTTYAQVLLDSNLGTFDADINSGNVRLKFSPTKNNVSVKLRAIRTTA